MRDGQGRQDRASSLRHLHVFALLLQHLRRRMGRSSLSDICYRQFQVP